MHKNDLLKRITEQLENTRRDRDTAARALENLREALASEQSRLPENLWRNVQRQARKNPEPAERLSDAQLAELRAELQPALAQETERVLAELHVDPSWQDTRTVFLDLRHPLWLSLKNAETTVNRVLRKYNLPPITLETWTWISEKTHHITQDLYIPTKKKYSDLKKMVEYIEGRLAEEERLQKTSERLNNL